MKRLIVLSLLMLTLAGCASVEEPSMPTVSAPESSTPAEKPANPPSLPESSHIEELPESTVSSDIEAEEKSYDVLFTLDDCTIQRMFMTPEGKLVCQARKDSGVYLMLLDTDGNLLEEVETDNETLFRRTDGFVVGEKSYSFDLQTAPVDNIGYAFTLSDDAGWLLLQKPDGMIEKIYATGAESYDDFENYHVVYPASQQIDRYLIYSTYAEGGFYDTNSETLFDFEVKGGFMAIGKVGKYITGHGRYIEGGNYPYHSSISRIDTETGIMESLTLPDGSFPWTDFSDGKYFIVQQRDAFGIEQLIEYFPGLADCEQDFVTVYDAENLMPWGYLPVSEQIDPMQSLISTDGKWLYGWIWKKDGAEIYRLPILPPDH